MAESLDRMKKKRATLRSMATRLVNRIEKILEENIENTEDLEESLEQLKLKEESLNQLDGDIERATDDDHLEEEIHTIEEYRERITLWKGRVGRYLRKKGEEQGTENGTSTTTGKTNSNIKLPRLSIEKFYGDSSNWQNFWAQYSSAINENENLTKVDKFNYLKSFIGGAAANAIAGLMLTNENYDVALKILSDRFGRRDIVISAHMNNLLDVAPVRNSNDILALRKLYDSCEVQVRSLESMGVISSTYSSLLCPILLKNIPKDIALEFNRKREKDVNWDILELLNLLRQEVESRERTELLTKQDQKGITYHEDKVKRSEKNEFGRSWKARQGLMPSAASLNTALEYNCLFCQKSDHITKNCPRTIKDKKEIVMKQGRCLICLKRNHIAAVCRSKFTCSNCKRRHHTTLCEKMERVQDKSETVVASLSHQDGTQSILLQTVKALVKGNQHDLVARCLLDSGSQRSFIREDISRQLKLPRVGLETLKIHVFGKDKPNTVQRHRVKVVLENPRHSNEYITIEALETPDICSALIQVPGDGIRSKLLEEGLELSEELQGTTINNNRISVLIGTDYYWKAVTGNIKRLDESLVALETHFGWSVHGPDCVSLSTGRYETSVMKIVIGNNTEEDLASHQLAKFWELDSLGITEPSKSDMVIQEEIITQFESSVQRDGFRYKVKLPWKDEMKDKLSNNRDEAVRRMKGLIKRFQKNPLLYEQYDDVMQEYMSMNIVEPVEMKMNLKEDTSGYYMPHQAVIKNDRTTTKLRVVFDASSKRDGEHSLNDCLNCGPNLNPDLFELLVRFRGNRIAITADIEKAFLQVELDEDEREFTKFLWTENPTEKEPKLTVLRMTRVVFGITSSPFLLAATIKHHLRDFKEQFPDTCKILDESVYVDDLITGAENVTEAYKISTDSQTILESAGMTFRKWQTNSRDLREKWNQANQDARILPKLIGGPINQLKVLGIAWDEIEDTFRFNVSHLLSFLLMRKDTKRYVLQAAGRIYDPVGFLTPFTIRVKCLFQELWTKGLEWDEKLPEESLVKWERWCLELKHLELISIPRYYLAGAIEESLRGIQLHCFSDASEKAYGTVIYLRKYTEKGNVITAFVCSKSRVTPLKKITLPRLELMGALLSARLSEKVQNCLKTRVTCRYWTDSQIVCCWIKGKSDRYKQFVHNRIVDIQSITNPSDWSHCPGKSNPADLLTRGLTVKDLIDNNLWWSGPDWLLSGQNPRPNTTEMTTQEEDCAELKPEKDTVETVQVYCNTEGATTSLIDLDTKSSYSELIRITGWINRFIFNIRNGTERKKGVITAEEIRISESFWIKHIQEKYFQVELSNLMKGKPLPQDSKLTSLNPFLDEKHILRVGGRMNNTDLSFNQKHPVILPNDSRFSELLIKCQHEKSMHEGIAYTLAAIRQRFWIQKGRQTVKKIIRNCLICRKYSAKPALEITAPLPKERIQETPPFYTTGIDFAGPLMVRGKNEVEKAYIALFTCAVTRAIHLELISDLSADKFLLSFRRFIARRGRCSIIFSDNAKTFKRAEKDLKKIWQGHKDHQVQEYLGEQGITWRYIVEKAAWWGGFWERLVRSVKTCLRKTLGRALLTFEELTTVLTEVEALLNSRPLTFSYNDVMEPEPLTPAHFLMTGNQISEPPYDISKILESSSASGLTKRKEYRQRLLRKIWKVWKNQYLMDLRSTHHLSCTKRTRDIKENDIVLINDENKPKLLWKMGKVVEVFIGRDGKVRSCNVKVGHEKFLKRPIQLLSPLELEN